MKDKNQKDSFTEGLKDIYHNEKKFIEQVSEEIGGESTERLDEAFQNHLEETENEITRLEQLRKKKK